MKSVIHIFKFTSLTSILLAMCVTLFMAACQPKDEPTEPTDPVGTIYYTESNEVFANPERGFYVQVTTRSNNIKVTPASSIRNLREDQAITLVLNQYYLGDYYECDIAEEYLEMIRTNMENLREGGGKCIPRFAYTNDNSNGNKEKWDAPEEWVHRHIDQLTPIFHEYADVIYCVQAGFVGVWGEWYYTTHFNTDEGFAPRERLITKLLEAIPDRRQLALRTPEFKIEYLGSSYVDTITAEIAHDGSPQARLAGHNDCFLSSGTDVGTYSGKDDRSFWAADTRFTSMGGESCDNNAYGKWDRALSEMYKYHWTYMNRDYHKELLNSWTREGHMDEVKRLLGYRLVLDKMWYTAPKAGEAFTATLTLRNIGFANIINPRAVELILVNTADATDKHVLPIRDADPRFWMAGETTKVGLKATLPATCQGEYTLYLNLPDPEPTIHDKPAFAIRLANNDIWEPETGYNKLATIVVE